MEVGVAAPLSFVRNRVCAEQTKFMVFYAMSARASIGCVHDVEKSY